MWSTCTRMSRHSSTVLTRSPLLHNRLTTLFVAWVNVFLSKISSSPLN